MALLGTGSALVAVVFLSAFAVRLNSNYSRLVQAKADELFMRDLDHIVSAVYDLVRSEGDSSSRELSRSLDVAYAFLEKEGGVSVSAPDIDWQAIDQYSGRLQSVRLPRLLVGRKWLGQTSDFGVKTPYVDEVSELLGVTVTVFQRMNEAGDMLRVATTVPRAGGSRATGTFLPRWMPDGSANPVVERVMAGGHFNGRAVVVDDWYLTAYEPLRSPGGEIAGMLYVGRRQAEVEELIRSAIIRTKIGDSGYVFVVSGRGDRRGRYVVSKDGLRDGEDIWDVRDGNGKYPARELIDEALRLAPGEVRTVRYNWRNPGESSDRAKIVRLAYYAPWDWVIGAGAYEDEWQAWRAPLTDTLGRFSALLLVAAVLIVLGVGYSSFLIARGLSRPLSELSEAARAYAGGAPWRSIGAAKVEEIRVLSDALDGMAEQIRKTVMTLTKSEERYRGVFENAVEGIFITRVDGSVLDINPSMARMVGFRSREEGLAVVSDVAEQIYENREDRKILLSDLAESGISVGREFRFLKQDGTPFWVTMNAWTVRDEQGRPTGLAGLVTDIDERKRTDAALRATLAQKEALVREVHHRVKNNLQILISLLGLESKFTDDVDAIAVLGDFSDRVRAMARVHGLVYVSPDLNSADMREYVRIVIGELFQVHRPEFVDLDYSIEGDPAVLPLDQAIPCGLLMNEILGNSFRHAFPPDIRASGRIVVSFSVGAGGELAVRISDDGVGLPEGVGPGAEGRLGMMLIPVLASQIGAELSLERNGGTAYEFRFVIKSV